MTSPIQNGGAPNPPPASPSPAAKKKDADNGPSGKPPEPALPKGDFHYAKVPGTLFVDGPRAKDVEQGDLGDCFFLAPLDSLAQRHPEAIERAIGDNGDGTYTVRLYKRISGQLKPIDLRVDGALPLDKSHIAFASSSPKRQLWVPIMEKAFAQLLHGYNRLDKGGYGGFSMEALTGKPSQYLKVLGETPDSLFTKLQVAIRAGRLTEAETYPQTSKKTDGPDSQTIREALPQAIKAGLVSAKDFNPKTFTYGDRQLVADHAYTILGVTEEGGQKYVQLRNPYGSLQPAKWGDGHNDGVFKLPLNEFAALYTRVYIGG